jgi:hypothetical protein
MKYTFFMMIFLLVFHLSCTKQKEDIDKIVENKYPWSDSLFFNGSINGDNFYVFDTSINKIGSFGEINFKWHADSISRKYGVSFDFENGYSLTINYLVIGSHNDFDTVSGCFKDFFNMISLGRQSFLFDNRPIPKFGFYTLYFKKDLSKDTIYYLPKYMDFQDSIDYYLYISKAQFDIDTSYSRVTQELFFEGNLSCKLLHSDMINPDTIKIEKAKFRAKFDQSYDIK